MRHEPLFMETFKGYVEWDVELKEAALERLLREYIYDYDGLLVPEDFRFLTYVEIDKDIYYYESIEQYEICRALKDLQDYL